MYQIDQNFTLTKDLQSNIPTNVYFGHQRAVKLGNGGLNWYIQMLKFETLLPSNANIMAKSLQLFSIVLG